MTTVMSPLPPTAQALAEPLQSAEFAQLRPKLVRHARLLVFDTSVAEDLVQETLLAVFEQQQKFKGGANLQTWASAILKNKVADWYRSPNRTRMVSIETDASDNADPLDALYTAQGEHAAPVPAWQQPDAALERQQLKQTLDQCVHRLAHAQAAVFMMREWLGFEASEIALRLGISADNCRMLLHRSRLSLRDCLQVRWYGKESV